MAIGKKSKRFLVLGVGNILLKDEGLGVRAVEYIIKRYRLPAEVTAVDGGTAGLALFSLVKEFEHIIILDAVAPKASPGAVYRIPGKDLPKSPPLMSTAHQLGIQDMLAIADLEGISPDVVVIGMEPRDTSVGLDLSETVKERLPVIAGMVVRELESHGIELRKSDGHA